MSAITEPPTPAEILKRSLEVQAGWSPEDRYARLRGHQTWSRAKRGRPPKSKKRPIR